MTKKTMKAWPLLILAIPLGSLACTSQAGAICSLECECEHCNDIEESVTCDQYETEAEIAEAYDCLEEWEAWATCVEDKGECDEDEARFSTQESGSCSGTVDIGLPCATDDECEQFGGTSCANGSCQARACEGTMQPCSSDQDCPTGEDRCGDEREELSECQQDASGIDNPFFGFD